MPMSSEADMWLLARSKASIFSDFFGGFFGLFAQPIGKNSNQKKTPNTYLKKVLQLVALNLQISIQPSN